MLDLNKDNFEQEVLGTPGLVLVDYWGTSCEPCKALMPEMEKLMARYGDKLKFCKLNTSENRRLAIGQKVLGLPTLIIYKDGQKIKELSGAENCTPKAIEDMIQETLAV